MVFFDRGQHLIDAHLDAEVDDFVAIVGEDDVDQVLANVVHVALDGREHHASTSTLVALFHERFEVGNSGLHGLGALEHEG